MKRLHIGFTQTVV